MRLPALPTLAIAAACLAAATPLAAQRTEPSRAPDACDYRTCAYNLVPRGLGLAVVRGEAEAPVATLGFLWTRDVSAAFDGEAVPAARAAVRTRRWAAVFTDLGLALLVAGAASAATDDLDQTAAAMMIGGAASVGVSVPLQFLADKHLARAVWRHNARYAEGGR